MKVLLVTNFEADRQESMLRFGRLLAGGLPDHGVEVVTLAPAPRLTRLLPRYRYDGWPKYAGYLDKFVLFPSALRRAVRRHRPDVVHIVDHANSALTTAVGGTPVLVTCHDLLQIRAARGEIPRHRPGWPGRRFQSWILDHLVRAPDIVCVSHRTREELLRLTERTPDRTQVIHNGLNHPYAPVPAAAAQRCLEKLMPGCDPSREPGGYYLNVGGGQWYKNRAGLLAIFAAIRSRADPPPLLVMVGKPLGDADAALVRKLGLGPWIRHLSNVDNGSLAALYSLAAGLIFPSWEEGFGWPIAEAQACGCPVFTSNRPPMTEVGGDAAVYFDPFDPVTAAHLILEARPQAAVQAHRGLTHARHWSAERMLGDYTMHYHQLAAAARGTPRHHENSARH